MAGVARAGSVLLALDRRARAGAETAATASPGQAVPTRRGRCKGRAAGEEPAPAHAGGARIGAAMTGGITMAAAEMRKMDWLGYQTLAVLIFFLLDAWAGSAGPLAWLPGLASLAALCHLGRTWHVRLGWAVRPHVWLD